MKAFTCVDSAEILGRVVSAYGVIFANSLGDAEEIVKIECGTGVELREIPIEPGYHLIG